LSSGQHTDAALYLAKQTGRDRVEAAPTRPAAPTISLIEAARL
jgi:hypothetical protein